MSQIDLGWDNEERALLDSAELDAPPPGAKARTLTALGVGAAFSTVVAAGGAKAAAGAGKGVVLLKVLTAVVIGGAAGGAALHYRAQLQHAKAVPAHAEPPRSAAPMVMASAVPSQAPIAPAEETPPPPDASTRSSRPPARAGAEPDIQSEIAALDRARGAAQRGDYAGALQELDRYDRAFQRGRLRPEALLLRVQTLLSKGDTAGAKALGARFLAHYPQSPLAPRIRKLTGVSP